MGLRTEKKYTDANGVTFVRMINKTGVASVLGEAVKSSITTDNAVELTGVTELECIGAMGESGIADGQPVWVARAGPVQFLLEDGTASVHGNWVQTSDSVGGRVDATAVAAPGLVFVHFQEVGHCAETQGSGTDVLCRVNCHFL